MTSKHLETLRRSQWRPTFRRPHRVGSGLTTTLHREGRRVQSFSGGRPLSLIGGRIFNSAQKPSGGNRSRCEALGVADLPLHGGRVPKWLAARMTTLGTAISESVIHHYGHSALLSRLSDPFWFQALGSVMGMDWHSSGITTSVLGALKRGLNPRAHELGIYICGGRGRHSRNTPDELRKIAEQTGLDGDARTIALPRR